LRGGTAFGFERAVVRGFARGFGFAGAGFAAGFAAPALRAPRLALRRSGRVRGRLLRTSRSPSAMSTSFLKREFLGAEAFCT
jgi:hypothetical protein